MTLPFSFCASIMVRNAKPGPPESDSSVPPVPEVYLVVVPATRLRLVLDVLFSNDNFRTAGVVALTGIPVTRYFPLVPTVPVIVIMASLPIVHRGFSPWPRPYSAFGLKLNRHSSARIRQMTDRKSVV